VLLWFTPLVLAVISNACLLLACLFSYLCNINKFILLIGVTMTMSLFTLVVAASPFFDYGT